MKDEKKMQKEEFSVIRLWNVVFIIAIVSSLLWLKKPLEIEWVLGLNIVILILICFIIHIEANKKMVKGYLAISVLVILNIIVAVIMLILRIL